MMNSIYMENELSRQATELLVKKWLTNEQNIVTETIAMIEDPKERYRQITELLIIKWLANRQCTVTTTKRCATITISESVTGMIFNAN